MRVQGGNGPAQLEHRGVGGPEAMVASSPGREPGASVSKHQPISECAGWRQACYTGQSMCRVTPPQLPQGRNHVSHIFIGAAAEKE